MQLTRTGGHSAQPLSARVVNGLLSSISRRAADKVGKICIIDDPKVRLRCWSLMASAQEREVTCLAYLD